MSTHRSILYVRRSIYPYSIMLTLLGGLLIAFQLILPATAFASSAHIAPSNLPLPTDPAFARAEVSVVRLVVSYNTLSLSKAPTPTATSSRVSNTPVPSCTGLGVLVGSWKNVNGTYTNWVLTDAALVKPTTAACASNTTTIASIDVYPNDVYTDIDASNALAVQSIHPLSTLVCQAATACTSSGVTSSFLPVSPSATLFSFSSGVPQPFVDIATQNVPHLAIKLTNASGAMPQSPLSTNNLAQNFLNPMPVSPPTARTEPGTPIVDAAGALVSIQVGLHPLLVTQANTILQNQPPLPATTTSHTNPLHDAWNMGITDFYAKPPRYSDAAKQFGMAASTNPVNPAFKAATTFMNLAVMSETSGKGPGPGGSTTGVSTPGQQLSSFIPLLLPIGLGLLGLIILFILIIWFVRARAHRREMERFKAEEAQARQTAELEMQRRQQPRQAASPVKRASIPRPTPVGSLPCPNCGQPVGVDAPYCPNCRYLLSSSPSGHLLARPATLTEAPKTPVLPTAPQPSAQDARALSDFPTLRIAPDGQADTEKLGPYAVERLTGRNLSLAVGTRSDPGIKRKYKPNEDSLLAMQGARIQNSQLQQFGLFVVADGMGGHANGQDASRLAIQTIINYMLPPLSEGNDLQDEGFLKLLSEGVQQANQAVYKHNQEQHADMGTTMTAALVVGSMAYVANVGDSRTYLYREPEGLSKITRDHSVVASLVDAGVIKPDDIYTHPKRNQIYRSLGEKPFVEVDTFKVALQPGDKLLLCSDGLWDMVRDPDIQRVIRTPVPDPSQIGNALIRAALDGGGEDNVSVIVVYVTEATKQTGVTGIQLLDKPDTVTVPNLPK